MALQEICPGNEVYTSIILGVGVGGGRLIGIVMGEIVAGKVKSTNGRKERVPAKMPNQNVQGTSSSGGIDKCL